MPELELRISDVDRDRAAVVLHEAVADGRLTWAEHEERLTAVYAARTATDLTPWLADLDRPGQVRAVSGRPSPPLQVTLGKVRRRPDPDSGEQHVDVTLGAAILDLRGLPKGCQLDVVANSTLGKIEVFVSPGTRLVDVGTAWLGKRSTVERRRRDRPAPVRADSPTVRLGGHSVLGHVRVTIG